MLVDTDIAVWGALCDAEIVALGNSNTESDEDESEELTPATLSEAKVSLNKLGKFFLQNHVDAYILQASFVLEKSIDKGRVVVYRACTPRVLGSGQGRLCLSSPLHWVDKWVPSLIDVLNTGGLSLDRPPNRDICSCTSASNGYVYWDGHSSSWPSWIVVPLSLSFKFEDCLTLGIPLR
ncbi:hypothetical protein TNCV_5122711 [Trichonephila clavipes]|nr:hypothetical protein TNCV_5122711 [Trichonephila clavipes]